MPEDSFCNPLSLTDRHILVTGAASGIGREIVLLADLLGAKIAMIDRNEEGMARTLSECRHHIHQSFVFDLRKLDDIKALVGKVVSAGGGLNGIVHAAGIQNVVPLKALEPENWREIFAVNTEAALVLAKSMASKRAYAGGNGSIVFISSVMGLVGSPGAIAYSMSKAALHGIARSMALELAAKGIRVNCIAPGFVRTALFERVEKLWDAEQRSAVEAQHPLGFGQPVDIANATAFLLSDAARWITGSVMVVDGGYSAQ